MRGSSLSTKLELIARGDPTRLRFAMAPSPAKAEGRDPPQIRIGALRQFQSRRPRFALSCLRQNGPNPRSRGGHRGFEREDAMQFRVSPDTLQNYSTAEWQARVDLAAAHRLAFNQGFSEGIFNHLTLV